MTKKSVRKSTVGLKSVWFIDGSATVRTAVVLKHQKLIILTVEHLEAGGAHGDAHIRQQGAEVFPFERPGPAFDQDVPPAHGAQHRATHLDRDKVRAPLLKAHFGCEWVFLCIIKTIIHP